jgi:hypothetical protein
VNLKDFQIIMIIGEKPGGASLLQTSPPTIERSDAIIDKHFSIL